MDMRMAYAERQHRRITWIHFVMTKKKCAEFENVHGIEEERIWTDELFHVKKQIITHCICGRCRGISV